MQDLTTDTRCISPQSALTIVTLLIVAILTFSCSGEEPGVLSTSDTTSGVTGGWIVASMANPEYESACAGTEGCGDARYPGTSVTETLWRVVVTRDTFGKLRIEQIKAIEVPEGDGVPVAPLAGQYALVGLDSTGAVVDGQPIQFPEKMRVESFESPTPIRWVDLSDREVSTVGFVRASSSIVTLAIQNQDRTTLTESDVPFDAALLERGDPGGFNLTRPAWAFSRPFQGLPPYCSHVIILDGENDRHLAAGIIWESTVTLIRPGPYQIAATQAALGRMTPLLCQSVRRIAFGIVPNEDSKTAAVNSVGAGDMILINAGAGRDEATLEEMVSRRLYLQRDLLHEAGHCAETILTAEGSNPGTYGGAWGFPPRTLANKTIDRVRLEKSLQREWLRMHESFVDQGWALDYPSKEESKARSGWSARQVTEAGFMSGYGATSWWDDIAEFVAQTYMSGPITAAYAERGVSEDLREDLGCKEMQAYGEKNLPARFAAAYTKLLFIQDLGLVEPEDVRACMGNSLGLPVDGEGFHVWQDTMKLRSFENRLSAGIGTTKTGGRIYQMEAYGEASFSDKTYPAKFYMRLDLGGRFDDLEEVSWPRGIYELGLMGSNNLELRLDGAKAGDFNAMDGFVLVAEASNDRIAGSIVLQRVFRLHAPLPVPEKYDPPLIVRFMIEN